MSRVGRSPIDIPAGVQVDKDGDTVTVKGPKGTISQRLSREMDIQIGSNQVLIKRPSDGRSHRALHGLTRSLLFNMVKGVTDGFEKVLEIQGVGYKALKKGQAVELSLGHSHSITVPHREGIEIDVPQPTKVIVKGIDKKMVGEVAANIRALRKVEPYKGKGIRYQGEYVRKKAGKAAAK